MHLHVSNSFIFQYITIEITYFAFLQRLIRYRNIDSIPKTLFSIDDLKN